MFWVHEFVQEGRDSKCLYLLPRHKTRRLPAVANSGEYYHPCGNIGEQNTGYKQKK
jgi:hypothetical protein